jgi:parallel beta-helix repeat protein
VVTRGRWILVVSARRSLLATALAASTAIVLAPSPAQGAPLACGDVVTEDVILRRDITSCEGDGLVVGAGGITIDLGGHTISGSNSDDSAGIRIEGHDGVTVRNGTITAFEAGVLLASGADTNLVQDLVLTKGGGVFVFNSTSNVVTGNRALDGGAGVFLETSGDNLVTGNTLVRNVVGISVSSGEGNEIVRNVARAGSDTGIEISDSDSSLVVGNRLVGNGFIAGLRVLRSDQTRIRGNVAIGNPIGIEVFDSTRTRLRRNRAAENIGDGIVVTSGSSDTLVEANEADLNGDDGIDVDAADTVITSNAADDNVDLGIEAVPGVIDGGGNTASGNGNAAQCLNVACS